MNLLINVDLARAGCARRGHSMHMALPRFMRPQATRARTHGWVGLHLLVNSFLFFNFKFASFLCQAELAFDLGRKVQNLK